MTSDGSALALLVLGGTSWLGGAVARHAAGRGHRVTCLARGESGTPPAGVTFVRADRADPAAYDRLTAGSLDWDAVVDVSWQPAFVRSALAALAARTGHWVYVSSCSAYAEDDTPDTDESATLHPPYDGDAPVDWPVYGPAKVACEQACVAAMGAERVLLARAGLIGGYGDRSDRLGYWAARVARAEDDQPVLVPPRDLPLQVVDVDDLADWLVRCAEDRTDGAFNAVGDRTSLGAFLDTVATVAGRAPRWVEGSHAWLASQQVEWWAGPGSLPLWLPQPEYAGFSTRRNDAARRAGLLLRPLEGTVRGALRWEQEQGLGRERRAGLTADRETELLSRLDDPSAGG